jgi:hypothetical protein
LSRWRGLPIALAKVGCSFVGPNPDYAGPGIDSNRDAIVRDLQLIPMIAKPVRTPQARDESADHEEGAQHCQQNFHVNLIINTLDGICAMRFPAHNLRR